MVVPRHRLTTVGRRAWSGTLCRTTSEHSRTTSPLYRVWKPGFSPDTSVFSALETFVIIALYKATFTIPYHEHSPTLSCGVWPIYLITDVDTAYTCGTWITMASGRTERSTSTTPSCSLKFPHSPSTSVTIFTCWSVPSILLNVIRNNCSMENNFIAGELWRLHRNPDAVSICQQGMPAVMYGVWSWGSKTKEDLERGCPRGLSST